MIDQAALQQSKCSAVVKCDLELAVQIQTQSCKPCWMCCQRPSGMPLFSLSRRSKTCAPQLLRRKLPLQTSEHLNLQLQSYRAQQLHWVMPVHAVKSSLEKGTAVLRSYCCSDQMALTMQCCHSAYAKLLINALSCAIYLL